MATAARATTITIQHGYTITTKDRGCHDHIWSGVELGQQQQTRSDRIG